MLYGEINRQRLKIINEHVVADTIDYLEARFAFSEDWDGLEKWVHFAKDGEVYDIRLTDDCIRKEDHLNLSAGIWKVYLHGNEFSGGKVIERITTNAAILKVEPTGALDGEPFPEMPASVTEQILARLENVEQNGGGSGGGISRETDPTVPDWAKQPEKPKYTATEVGAVSAEQFEQLFGKITAKADKPTYSDGNLQIGDNAITAGIEWDYADGLPEDNGLTFTGTAGTAVLQDGGVLLSAGAKYKFPVLTAKSATLECVFSIPSFATYQYGFRMQVSNGTKGIRISCYLGELRFNQNTNGNTTITQLANDTEYTLRIEWDEANGANVYLNGSQVLTNASTKYALDEIDIGQFYSGTTLLKSVSFQCDNVGAIEISSINGVELCDTKARAMIAGLNGNGTVPENVALLEDVPEDDTNGDFIPMLSPNGTEYRFAIRDNGFPVIMDINGNVVWSGTSGGTDEEPGGGETPDDGGEGGETPDASSNWSDGVPYTLTGIAEGYYIEHNTGELVSEPDGGYNATDYLYVYGAGWLYIPDDCRYSALYDINKQYVGGLYGYKAKGGYFEISENAVYIRISGDWVNETAEIVPYADVNPTWTDGVVYDLGNLVENTYIQGGNEINYNGWASTDYINCAHANRIVIEGFSPNNTFCAYYDMKRRYVQGFKATDGVVSIPTGVCYFRISGSNSDMAKLIVTPYAQ